MSEWQPIPREPQRGREPEPHMRTFEADGRRYEWGGGFGAVFVSYERNIAAGDVRMIEGELFYAYIVQSRGWRRPRVCWTQPKITVEHLREIQARVFGVATFESRPAVGAVARGAGISTD